MVLNTDGRTDGDGSHYMPQPLSWRGHDNRVNNEAALISGVQRNSLTTRERALRPARSLKV